MCQASDNPGTAALRLCNLPVYFSLITQCLRFDLLLVPNFAASNHFCASRNVSTCSFFFITLLAYLIFIRLPTSTVLRDTRRCAAQLSMYSFTATLLLVLHALLPLSIHGLPSPASSTAADVPSLSGLQAEFDCHKTTETAHIIPQYCSRTILSLKNLYYFNQEIEWSENARGPGHLPFYAYYGPPSQRCYLTMDASSGVEEHFSLREVYLTFARLWRQCIKLERSVGLARVGPHKGVQVLLGPLPHGPWAQTSLLQNGDPQGNETGLPEGWFAGFDLSEAVGLDLNGIVDGAGNATAATEKI